MTDAHSASATPLDTVTALRRAQRRSTQIICVTIEIRESAVTHRVQITAPSIERALKVARGGKPGRRVRLVFPIDPEAFFIPDDCGCREAA
jgi:hypothetical protein